MIACAGGFGGPTLVSRSSGSWDFSTFVIPQPDSMPPRLTPPDRRLVYSNGGMVYGCDDVTGDGVADIGLQQSVPYEDDPRDGVGVLAGWDVPWDEENWWSDAVSP